MNVGDCVQFVAPSADEVGDRFVVVELRGPRVLVQVADWQLGAIVPTAAYLAKDLQPCAS
jgi:hypothetical protein